MSEENVENPLGYEKISTLLRKFAVPGIIAMVVNSIYNIVDQIFIGWGVGYLGNAATNVAFPVTVIAVAVFLSLGVGGATRYSIYLGEKRTEDAAKVVGIAVTAAVAFGIIYAAFVLNFSQCFYLQSYVLLSLASYILPKSRCFLPLVQQTKSLNMHCNIQALQTSVFPS